MGNSRMIMVCLLTAIVSVSCQRAVRTESKIFSDIKLKPDFKYEGRVCKESIESLLAEVWTSGFIKNSDLVREEIVNNNYGFFRKTTEFTCPQRGRALYKKEERKKDRIMLHKNLFRHPENHFGTIVFKKDKRVAATLVHELFHDFWYNILDRRKNFLFTMDAEIFYIELDMAKTPEDKLRFLRNIGLKKPCEENFKAYEGLKDYKEQYPDKKFYGTELYAIIAERAFSGKIIIPKQLRKFYYGIISESMLKKNEL